MINLRNAARVLALGLCAAALAACLVFVAPRARAQVPSSNPPYNVDIGAVLTGVGQNAGTYNSTQLNNLDKEGVTCVLSGLGSTGGPSVVFAIQGYDAASNSYYDLVRSGSITAAANAVISVRPGNQTSSLPTGWSASQSLPVPRFWRIQEVITGGTGLTSTVSCNQQR